MEQGASLNNAEIGDLKAFRKKYGYSQNDMARYLGISHVTYIAYEKGRRTLSPKLQSQFEQLQKGENRLLPDTSLLSTTTMKEVQLADGLYNVITTVVYLKQNESLLSP